jgi:nicotinamide phosphoribosyltransferase
MTKANQRQYILGPNPIMKADSYKFSHPFVYKKGITGMFSYLEARTRGDTIVPAGAQMWAMKNLMTQITKDHVDEAEAFAAAHGEPFQRSGWDKVVDVYDGYLPVKIRVVPEGLRVPSQNIIASVECTDPDLFWLSSQLETNMQRGIWYPTTIASNDYKNWRAIRRFALETADTLDMVPFSLHDFGGRGVSSAETAEIGGMAHLIYFMGSDTIEGVRAANFYYDHPMAAFSVPASEHTVQCSFGDLPWDQHEYLLKMLSTFAKKGKIVSIVMDGYNVYRETDTLITMKDLIIASGAKVVLRPDSGNPLEVIAKLLQMLAAGFGVTVNSKGYKVLNYVGILQGDGIDYNSMVGILEMVTGLGYSSDCIVFGSGGGLLQKVNRDTYKFAQKASAILVDGVWKPIAKNPITDPGKKSKAGRLTLVKSVLTGEFRTVDLDKEIDSEWVDQMVTLYENGELFNLTTLDEVRARAQS